LPLCIVYAIMQIAPWRQKDMTKRVRQQKILEIISSRRIESQQELAQELLKRGIGATQSSVSRDIVDLGLVKVDGFYSQPREDISISPPLVEIETAGDFLIVIKTEIGLAQPTALTIDRTKIDEVIGTIAGDDTIFVAVRNQAAQRLAINKITKALAPRPRTKPASRPAAGSNGRKPRRGKVRYRSQQ